MKKILIPTDFSSIADNATMYAIGLAEAFKSKLFLDHVYDIKKADYDRSIPDKEQPYRKKMKATLEESAKKFEEIIREKGLSLQTKAYQGVITSLFGKTVRRDGIDLIVMGSKGASGMTKIIYGSVAATALEESRIPLLVVPPEYTFQPLQHIVLAIDNKEIAAGLLSPLQKLAAKFGAKVTILNIYTDSNNEDKKEDRVILDGVQTIYRSVPMSQSINESISRFVAQTEEGCDLLCMVRRKKSFFERILKKSLTKTQVYDNRIPLLILPEND